MEDNVKKYLEDLEVPYNAEHWNLMEQRMAIEELSDFTNNEDKVFDDYVRKELQFEEPVYNSLHWELMANKLEERTWRGFIYKYKLAEVGLMMLLLWTVWFTIIPTKEEVDLASNMSGISPIEKHEPGLIHKTETTPNKHFKSTTIRDKSEVMALLNGFTTQVNHNNTISTLDGLGSFTIVYKLPQPSVLDKNIIASIFHSAAYSSYAESQRFTPQYKFTKVSPDIRIGVFAASGIESVSSEDKLKEAEEPNLAYGYGGGISLGLRFKDIEFETGASYNALVPMHASADATTNRSSQKNIDAASEDEVANKFLKLPFALKYLFDNEGSWKFYALGGGNLHIDVNNKDFQPRSSSFAFESKARLASAVSSSQLNQGATFFDRFYYSASIGFGVEKQLSDKLSVFVQPEYYHQLYKSTLALGTGQTNTFTLSVGLKSSL